jgi:hypothetical protein
MTITNYSISCEIGLSLCIISLKNLTFRIFSYLFIYYQKKSAKKKDRNKSIYPF